MSISFLDINFFCSVGCHRICGYFSWNIRTKIITQIKKTFITQQKIYDILIKQNVSQILWFGFVFSAKKLFFFVFGVTHGDPIFTIRFFHPIWNGLESEKTLCFWRYIGWINTKPLPMELQKLSANMANNEDRKREIDSFYQLSEWNENSQDVLRLFLLVVFHNLFLPSFVLGIFKFKHDKFFIRKSAATNAYFAFYSKFREGTFMWTVIRDPATSFLSYFRSVFTIYFTLSEFRSLR